ncbi:riboflavin synthase [Candidatus Atelocyanobacterium thalassae]|uniref:Riboflavin synthase n=1 Tax=cyanobacterium endosymbiont of Braarudosphaera bigelowii TaxID=1285375 RepID=A0ABM7U5R2_9CHRO|nr:riboflavin synthase [Candidatus Atelocyanobacterium thalassa]BDA39713.1 riboflavin synthase [cyanobacterium endosymbiont of Braarudosphaera bigelowii]
MFTGLIENLGMMDSLESNRFILTVLKPSTTSILSTLSIGDSIAVDGVCLTAENLTEDGFIATVSSETLQRTNLSQKVKTTNYVNLESSLCVGSKLGGHFVTGHVDGIGSLVSCTPTNKAWELTFAAPYSRVQEWSDFIQPYLITKGSIAVNGISLTIAECDLSGTWFTIAVIPHTYTHTNLCYLKPGDLVNIEGDILGKYVEKFISKTLISKKSNINSDISSDFLVKQGYL